MFENIDKPHTGSVWFCLVRCQTERRKIWALRDEEKWNARKMTWRLSTIWWNVEHRVSLPLAPVFILCTLIKLWIVCFLFVFILQAKCWIFSLCYITTCLLLVLCCLFLSFSVHYIMRTADVFECFSRINHTNTNRIMTSLFMAHFIRREHWIDMWYLICLNLFGIWRQTMPGKINQRAVLPLELKWMVLWRQY